MTDQYIITEEQLKQAFAECGNVESVKIATDKFTQRSRGFGFVTFDSVESAQKAIADKHQQDIDGRLLVVSQSR